MGKLGTRQGIILGVMGIAVLYAAFDFLTPKKKSAAAPDMAQRTTELSTFVTDLTAGLGKDTTKNLNTLIFSRAEKEWLQDPFLDARSLKAWGASKAPAKKEGGAVAGAAPKVVFIYSGFVDTGRKRMAIINGIEYAEGDGLDIKGYVLKSASPTKVVIENRGTGATINVPLLE